MPVYVIAETAEYSVQANCRHEALKKLLDGISTRAELIQDCQVLDREVYWSEDEDEDGGRPDEAHDDLDDDECEALDDGE